MNLVIRPMTIEDYDKVFAMWQITTRRALSSADSRESIAKYLKRNPGMSQIALDGDLVVGTVLAGHDGRLGFIHHMAVRPEYRRHHIGRELARTALGKIAGDGIETSQIYCFSDNSTGQDFWSSLGYTRTDNILFEKVLK